MDPIPATITEFNQFLDEYGYCLKDFDDTRKTQMLNRAFAFISTLEFCQEGSTVPGQCEIAYQMALGAFDPSAATDGRSLTERSIGRNALVRKWSVDESLQGTEPVTLLQRLPLAYGMLKSLLCEASLVNDTDSITNFEVVR